MALRSALLTRTFLKAAALEFGNGFAGLGVEQCARGSLVSHDMIGGIDHEAIVAERLQNGGGLRRRLGRQLSDRGCGLGKLVVEELRERVVDGVGASGGRERHESQDTDQRAESLAHDTCESNRGRRRDDDSIRGNGLCRGRLKAA